MKEGGARCLPRGKQLFQETRRSSALHAAISVRRSATFPKTPDRLGDSGNHPNGRHGSRPRRAYRRPLESAIGKSPSRAPLPLPARSAAMVPAPPSSEQDEDVPSARCSGRSRKLCFELRKSLVRYDPWAEEKLSRGAGKYSGAAARNYQVEDRIVVVVISIRPSPCKYGGGDSVRVAFRGNGEQQCKTSSAGSRSGSSFGKGVLKFS